MTRRALPIHMHRPHFRFALTIWIAILAALWGVVAAPTMASMHAWAPGSAWVEVCTSDGTLLVAMPADESRDGAANSSNSSHSAQNHCPYCRLQQDLPDIVHAPGVLVLADGSVRHTPRARPSNPPPATAIWAACHSRAPPSPDCA